MLSRFPYRKKKIEIDFFIPKEDNTLQQQATMPRFTRTDKEENDKIVFEKSKMEDEDLLSQFNSVPDAIKLLCEKKVQYEVYVSHLKKTNLHIKNAEVMFNYQKRSKLDTITWIDGDAKLFVNGMHINLSPSGIGRRRHTFGGIHRHRATKEIIEDYNNGLIPVCIKIKVKKNRSKKMC